MSELGKLLEYRPQSLGAFLGFGLKLAAFVAQSADDDAAGPCSRECLPGSLAVVIVAFPSVMKYAVAFDAERYEIGFGVGSTFGAGDNVVML